MEKKDGAYLSLLRDIYTNERTERGRRLGATLIEREMEYQVDNWNKDWVRKHPFPSYQWIEKELRKFKDPTQTPPEEQAAYATFSWPESMGEGGVPWAESRKALELLSYFNEKHLPRPSIGMVNRYWQISYALPPDALVSTKAEMATHLVQADTAEDKAEAYRYLEWALAYDIFNPEDDGQKVALWEEAQRTTEQRPLYQVIDPDGKAYKRKFGTTGGRYQQIPASSGRMSVRQNWENALTRDGVIAPDDPTRVIHDVVDGFEYSYKPLRPYRPVSGEFDYGVFEVDATGDVIKTQWQTRKEEDDPAGEG